MARNAGATREEVEAIIGKYRQSGLTRQEYCKREGVTVYMLDYYQRRLYKLRECVFLRNPITVLAGKRSLLQGQFDQDSWAKSDHRSCGEIDQRSGCAGMLIEILESP